MRISRITMFVLGSRLLEGAPEPSGTVPYAAQELWKDINDAVEQLCEEGSREALCATYFDGARFQPSVNSTIGYVRANPRAIVAGVQATRMCAIYLVNSALSAEEWARGIRQTSAAVRELGFTHVNHIAIVQKDDLDMDEPALIEALTEAGAAIYLFSQSTRAGWVLSSSNEERKLLSHYAILAATGLLNENHGVYTGTFNKLNLMEEDFRRIRIHYAVCALTNRLRDSSQFIDENALFADFIGNWIGNKDLELSSDPEVVGLSLKGKLTGLFPLANNAAIMANPATRAIDANIQRFIAINFEGAWFKSLLAHFEDPPILDQQICSPAGILGQWRAYLDNMLERHPEYYCREVVDFLRLKLLPWLDNKARRLRVPPQGAVQCEEKDPIAYAIVKTERSIRPYADQAASALLMGIHRLLEERVQTIQERIRARDEIISRNRWLLSDGELGDDRRFAEAIMARIENNSRTTIRPELRLVPSRDFFGEGEEVASNWEKLVEQQQHLLEDENELSLVSYLGKRVSAAEFTSAVSQQVQDLGERLPVDSARIYAEEQRVIYVCSDQLHADNVSRLLPKAGPRCTTVVVPHFDNLIEFTVFGLRKSGEAATSAAEVIGLLGNSRRMGEVGRLEARETYQREREAPEQEVPSREMHASIEVKGETLAVTLPMAFFQNDSGRDSDDVQVILTYTLTGYSANNTRANPVNRSTHVGGRLVNIPLGALYGHCGIELSCARFDYREAFEFDGQKVRGKLRYSRKRPLNPLSRRKTVSVNGDRVSFDHWVCKLVESNVRSIQAMVTLDIGQSLPLYYPVGEAGQWDVWLPCEETGDFALAPGDEARIYAMEELD